MAVNGATGKGEGSPKERDQERCLAKKVASFDQTSKERVKKEAKDGSDVTEIRRQRKITGWSLPVEEYL